MQWSRRDFLRGTAVGAAAMTWGGTAFSEPPTGLHIQRIDLYPVLYPTVMRFKFFEGPRGEGRPAVLIKITADDGTIGWGESVPVPRWSYETLEGTVSILELYLKPVLLGKNPFDLDEIHRVMNLEIAPSFSTGAPIAKAGIDLALHDLIGRKLGANVSQLWGRPAGEDLLLSWTLNPKTLDDLDELIDKGWERGYRNFNVKVAPDPLFDLELCRRVRDRVPEGFLWCDANGGYDLATALEVAPKLADLGVPVLEQPLPSNRLSGYRELKRQGALPIILDEGVVSPADLLEFIALDCCDGVAMKPARCGGLISAKRQLEILEDAGLMFLGSGLTDPDVSLAASLILYSSLGLKYPAALNGPQFLGTSLIREPLIPHNGRVRVPQGPGLGVEVDEARLAELVKSSGFEVR